jgi:molybdopterin-binding protein
LGISYPTLKQWIYRGKIKTAKTPGGHHRVPESEIDRLFPKKLERGDARTRRGQFRKISGRNQLVGRVFDIKYSGLLAQVTLAIGEQQITSIITADAAKEMRLKPGERAAALIKSTEVMILRV